MSTSPGISRFIRRDDWIGFGAGLGVIAAFCAVLWFQRSRGSPEELVLRDSVEQLSADSMRVYSLRVPRGGVLEIEATTAAGHLFSVYLAASPGTRPSKPNELRLFTSFTAEGIGHYQRSARVERGEYHLTLIKSALGESSHTVPTRLRARLKT